MLKHWMYNKSNINIQPFALSHKLHILNLNNIARLIFLLPAPVDIEGMFKQL